jgi:hypothetical protein
MTKKHKVPMLVIIQKGIKEIEYRFEENVPASVNEKEVEHVARRQVLQQFLARKLQVKKIIIEHAGA